MAETIQTGRRPALFLDRDGVINIDRGYVGGIEDFVFVDGIFDLVRAARRMGFVPVVVTNQSGIARGYYSEAEFASLTAWMLERFASEGAPVARVYFCPYLKDATVEAYRRDDPRRKPGPGMLLDAIAELGLDPAASAMLGDKWSDAQAAHAAGVRWIALVGHPDGDAPASLPTIMRLETVRGAIGWIETLRQQA